MRGIIHLLFGVVLLMAPATPALADRFDTVRAAIREQIREKSVPSVAVAVIKEGIIVWEEGFGWADREKRIPADANTLYSLASISKPITATGLMTLVQAGKIELDRPVNDYLGGSRLTARVGYAQDATVRRVAGHTAGLPVHYQFFYEDEAVARPPMDYTIQKYGNLVTLPGEKYQYSNLGYGILDEIISRISGASYADYMSREVFVPLGLTRTSVDLTPDLEPYAAKRYGKNGKPIPFYISSHSGASSVWSSAHDVARFAGFHLKNHLVDQKAILDDAAIDAMHAPIDPQAVRPENSGYALGFYLGNKDSYRVIYHGGGMGGASTVMDIFPDENLAIVVLANSGGPTPGIIRDKIAAVMLPGWKPTPIPPEKPKPSPFAPMLPLTGSWTGTLTTPTGPVLVELVFQGDGLIRAKFGDQLPTLVSGASFDKGFFNGILPARIPNPDTEGYTYAVRLTLKLRGNVLNGVAIAQGDSDNDRERAALGHWISLSKAR